MESAVADLTAETENPLRAGKIQNLLFSEELAKGGLLKIRDSNRINVANRYLADYAIVKGSPLTFLKILNDADIGSNRYCYLDKALSNGADAGICPNTLKHEFNIDFETEGIDPILPLLSYNERKKTVAIEGTALFNGDRLVGSFNREQSRYLSLLSSSAESIDLDIMNLREKDDHVMMNVISSKHKIKIFPTGKDIVIQIKIKLKSRFDISDWQEILEERNQNEVERFIEKSVAQKCGAVLTALQECGCDPLGVGASLRGFHPETLSRTDPKTAYRRGVIRIEVENRIINHEI